MSCAQVMYQPYAPNPYVVPQEPPSATPSSSSSAPQTLPSGPPSAESIHSHEAVLQQHHATALTQPPTPQPHIYHHLQSTPPTPHSSHSSGESVAPSGGGEGGVQRGALRPPHRSDSNGSAHGDPDAPPPEKRFCSEADAPSTPRTPSIHNPASVEHQHQQQQSPVAATAHHHHLPQHHQHHQQHQQQQHHNQLLSHHDLPHHSQQHHHHPPHTEHPPPSPTEENSADVKYLTANCMVVTYCKGDVMSVVDEHFTRALYEKPEHSPGKASPMSSRNFPPSFWNSHYQPPVASSSSRPPSLAGHLAGGAELYDPYHAGLYSLQHHGASDPWAHSLSSQAYGHRAHDVYQAAMAGVPSSSRTYHQYASSLSLQPHLPRFPSVPHQMSMGKADTWGARAYHDAFTSPELAAAHGLEAANYSANHYANMTAAGTNIKSEFSNHYANMTGLETAVPQEGAKDLYWF